ncbi:phage tail assembly protein [Pseudomonas sp. TNT2022 ID233]|uniref:phage tail assembly protein n=1 Tax=Pseudomonas aphyarum TaxID=2942629 RepID=UPI00235F1E15|nr:phage tail assembly protein [Pseudomonas aphyarum]MDD1141626.1 phage tail assembly protein [Pseudomonas aphyarum]
MQEVQPMNWLSASYPLQFPITLENGDALSEIALRPICVSEHRAAIVKGGKDNDDQFEQILAVATDLPESVLEQLKQPDYVSLVEIIHDYIKLPGTYFSGVKPENPDDFPLLVPIKGFGGRLIESLQIQVPAMKVSKTMRKLKTANERADFVSAHCVGLSVPEVQSLSLPDWTQLQERLNDFLNRPAAFFQSATST